MAEGGTLKEYKELFDLQRVSIEFLQKQGEKANAEMKGLLDALGIKSPELQEAPTAAKEPLDGFVL